MSDPGSLLHVCEDVAVQRSFGRFGRFGWRNSREEELGVRAARALQLSWHHVGLSFDKSAHRDFVVRDGRTLAGHGVPVKETWESVRLRPQSRERRSLSASGQW